MLGICFTIKPSRISRFSAPIIEPSSLGKSFFLNAHLCTHFPQKTKKTLIKVFEKYGTLHEFACHPCAGAMLIFSVSFQFQYMLINQQIYPLLSPLIYELTKGHKRHFCPQLMSYAHQMQLSDDIFVNFLLKKLKNKLAFFLLDQRQFQNKKSSKVLFLQETTICKLASTTEKENGNLSLPLVGLEPTIFELEVQRLIHQATGALYLWSKKNSSVNNCFSLIQTKCKSITPDGTRTHNL